MLKLRRRGPGQLRLEVFVAGPASDLAPDVGGTHAVGNDADFADGQGDGGHALGVVELGGALGLAKDKVLALAGQLDGHVCGRQRPLAALAAAQQRVHEEAGPGGAAADFGLDELLARGDAVARDARLARQVHDLDEADGHAQVYPGAPSVAGAPVMAGQHEEGLDAADGGRFEVLLQDLAGMGGIGIASLCLGAEGGRGVLDESGKGLVAVVMV